MNAEARSRVMRAVKGRRVRMMLVAAGISGFELNPKDIDGRPDIAFREDRLAVFVNGCFWHRCPMHFGMPRTNRAYWARKINKNVRRDRLTQRRLHYHGWSVLNIWEHALTTKGWRHHELSRIVATLKRRRNP